MMQTGLETKNMIVSRFDIEQKTFYLRSQLDADEIYAVHCNITLRGMVNGVEKNVNTEIPSSKYSVYRFANPYLNAENDLFKISYSDTTIGMIIPNSAIEDKGENPDEEFDEYEQAYKFYCAKLIIENFNFDLLPDGNAFYFSDFIDSDSIYFILCKPLILDESFKLENCLPSLAIKGYYLFPENTTPNVLELISGENNTQKLSNLIENKFLGTRENESIHLHKCAFDLEQIQLLKLLYKKLLVENSNSLYRFLVLYQVIEFLIEKEVRTGINSVFVEKDDLTNFDFFQKIHEINSTRRIIISLFESVAFDDKNEITNALKSFIIQNSPSYSKQATGDCLYDIRNLLFHDFKKVMQAEDESAVIGLVIQCEILIHNLINTHEF